jgi:hypothetical protein
MPSSGTGSWPISPTPASRRTGLSCSAKTPWQEHMQAYRQIDIRFGSVPAWRRGHRIGRPDDGGAGRHLAPADDGRAVVGVDYDHPESARLDCRKPGAIRRACAPKSKRPASPGIAAPPTARHFYRLGYRRPGRLCAGRRMRIPPTMATMVRELIGCSTS